MGRVQGGGGGVNWGPDCLVVRFWENTKVRRIGGRTSQVPCNCILTPHTNTRCRNIDGTFEAYYCKNHIFRTKYGLQV